MADIDNTTRLFGTVAHIVYTITADGTTTGVVIDTLGYESLDFKFLTGNLNIGADLDAVMEHSDDAGFGTYETVPADFIIGTLPSYLIANNEKNTVKSVGYVGKKRYVRVNVNATSYATDTIICAIAVLGSSRVDPTQSL